MRKENFNAEIIFNMKSIHKTLKKFLMELKGKLGQSSVNGLLNNSSSVHEPFAIAIHYGS